MFRLSLMAKVRKQNVGLRVMNRSSRHMSVRVMLARTKLLNILNQTEYQQMSLIKRVFNADSCSYTLAYLVQPNPRYRVKSRALVILPDCH